MRGMQQAQIRHNDCALANRNRCTLQEVGRGCRLWSQLAGGEGAVRCLRRQQRLRQGLLRQRLPHAAPRWEAAGGSDDDVAGAVADGVVVAEEAVGDGGATLQ